MSLLCSNEGIEEPNERIDYTAASCRRKGADTLIVLIIVLLAILKMRDISVESANGISENDKVVYVPNHTYSSLNLLAKP
jgi:hypothetical protein